MDASTRSKELVDAIESLRKELIHIKNYLSIPIGECPDLDLLENQRASATVDFFVDLTREEASPETSELLAEALKAIAKIGYASPLVLQHCLEISYRQAVCLLYQLERDGYVEPSHGFRPRKVINSSFKSEIPKEQAKPF